MKEEENKIDWAESFSKEFCIYFKDCPDELNFALVFIEELLDQQRKDTVVEVKNRVEKLFDDVFEPRLYGKEAREVAVRYESKILELLKEIE